MEEARPECSARVATSKGRPQALPPCDSVEVWEGKETWCFEAVEGARPDYARSDIGK